MTYLLWWLLVLTALSVKWFSTGWQGQGSKRANIFVGTASKFTFLSFSVQSFLNISVISLISLLLHVLSACIMHKLMLLLLLLLFCCFPRLVVPAGSWGPIYLFACACRRALAPTQPPIQWVRRVKRQELNSEVYSTVDDSTCSLLCPRLPRTLWTLAMIFWKPTESILKSCYDVSAPSAEGKWRRQEI
jgi:hypothetical protein